MKKKRIAIIVPELLPVPPVKGGAVEYWVHEVSQRINRSKFDVSIVSRPANVEGLSHVSYIGIEWTFWERFFKKIKDKVSSKNPLKILAKIQMVFSYGTRAIASVADYECVYIHNEPNLLFFIKNRKNQKIILHMHNDHLLISWLKPFYRKSLSKVDVILCVSDYIKNQAVKAYPEYSSKFVTINNATDTDVFKPYGEDVFEHLKSILLFDKSKKYLLYVGRLDQKKGVDVLLESFALINQEQPNTRLIIIGTSFFLGAKPTSYEEKLKALARPLGSKVIFTGFIHHEKIKYFYSSVDAVVVPSVWQEPSGLVALEAMSSGACLICSKVGGLVDFIDDGVDGFLVPPNSPELLKKCIIDVLEDVNKGVIIKKNARNKVINYYSWDRLMSELEPFFEEKL